MFNKKLMNNRTGGFYGIFAMLFIGFVVWGLLVFFFPILTSNGLIAIGTLLLVLTFFAILGARIPF